MHDMCIFKTMETEDRIHGEKANIKSLPPPSGKESACSAADPGSIPGSGSSPGEGMAAHSRILAWRIPWTEEPGSLQSIGHK